MRVKQFVSILLFAFLCCSLFAVAQAAKAPADNDSAYLKGPGTAGTIPVYSAAKKLKNSSITQDGSGNENFAAGINAAGVINGSSDVDASGNVNVTGYVFSQSFIESLGEMYAGQFVYSPGFVEAPTIFGDSSVSTPAVFSSYNQTGGEGWFQNPGSGLGIGVSDTDGTQVIQTQCLAGSGYEIASFDSGANFVFGVDCAGDSFAAGSKSAVVPLKSGKMVKVYSQESTKVWFEDFGSSNLVGGVATVQLESKYAQLVNTKLPYHVFLTPNGDCHGLYVSQKDRNSFEVRELNGGQSNVSFDYRISALRNGYENLRLAPANAPKMQKGRPAMPKR